MDLDKEFVNLKEGGTLKIKGKELVKDRFIEFKKIKFWIFWKRQVVEPFAGAKYFGEPFKVPASDHFSIAKPNDKNAIQHRLLRQFILENVPSPVPETRKQATELIGRETETKLLSDAWAKAQNNETGRPRVLT